MKKQYIYIGIISLALTLASCGGGQTKKSSTAETPDFPSIEVPVTISDPQEAANFMVRHFWDKFNFTDTAFLAHPDIIEQAFVEYIAVLPYAEDDIAEKSLRKLISDTQANEDMFHFFTEKTEHYLWEPNSPYRNDELYIPILEAMLASDRLDEATRMRSEYRLGLVLKNRIGQPANDFVYTLESGRTGRMSQIQSEYLLLFFNNPGCTACAEIIGHAKNSPVIEYLEKEKENGNSRLTILALYPDEDLEEWKRYIPNIPKEWINGYDKGTVIQNQNLYDLKAIPSLYLLDKDKNVILKDADIRQVEQFLQWVIAN